MGFLTKEELEKKETFNIISQNNTLKSRVINLINLFHIRSRKKRLLNFEKSIMLD